MRPKITITQLLEVTTIVAISLALDRVASMWSSGGWGHIVRIATVWGAVAGAYLGFRWSKRRGLWSILAAAGIAAAIVTILNATRLGIMIAEGLRRHYGYFNWFDDWPVIVGQILMVTIVATAIAPLLALLPFLCERLWRSIKK